MRCVEVYKDLVSGITRTYDQWLDEMIDVFIDEGLDEDRAFVEAIHVIAEMVGEGELEPLC